MKEICCNRLPIKPQVLINLYKAISLSRVNYGSQLLAYHSKSPLKKLETIQNEQLRWITRTRKSTPIGALQLETGILPLKNRRRWLTHKYLLALRTKTNNPANHLLKEKRVNEVNWKQRSTPVIVPALRAVQDAIPNFWNIQHPQVSTPPPWKLGKINTILREKRPDGQSNKDQTKMDGTIRKLT